MRYKALQRVTFADLETACVDLCVAFRNHYNDDTCDCFLDYDAITGLVQVQFWFKDTRPDSPNVDDRQMFTFRPAQVPRARLSPEERAVTEYLQPYWFGRRDAFRANTHVNIVFRDGETREWTHDAIGVMSEVLRQCLGMKIPPVYKHVYLNGAKRIRRSTSAQMRDLRQQLGAKKGPVAVRVLNPDVVKKIPTKSRKRQ